MYSWKRRTAANLNNVEQMRESRKIDITYQNLRRWEQDTAETDRRTSLLPKANRCKAQAYKRLLAEGQPVANKFSSSVNSTRSKMRNSLNKGSVSRLPAISTGTQRSGIQRRAEELASTSKTPRRAIAPLASDCNEQLPPFHKQIFVGLNSGAPKWSVTDTQSTPQKPTKGRGTLRGMSKNGAASRDHTNTSNVSTRRDPFSRTLDILSLPQPLISSGRSYTILPSLPSLQYPHSGDPEPLPVLPEISDLFEGSSENNSLLKEDILREVSYQAELSDPYQAELSDPYRAELSDPYQAKLSDPYQAKLSDPYQAKLSDPYQAKLSDPYQAKLSDPYQAELSDPYQAKLSDPYQAKLSDPYQAELSDPYQAKLSDPYQAELSDPYRVELSDTYQAELSDPYRAELSDPYQAKLSDPYQAELSDPYQAKLSDPYQAELSDPYRVELSDTYQAELSDPYRAELSDPYRVELSDPYQAKLSDHYQAELSDPYRAELSDPYRAELSDPYRAELSDHYRAELSDPYRAELSDHYRAELSDHYWAELSSKDSAATSVSSVPDSLLSQCPPSGSSMDTSSLDLHEPLTSTGPLSSHLCTFDLQSFDLDGEDGGYPWQDDFTARESCYNPLQRAATQARSSSHALISPSPAVRVIHLGGQQTQQSIESTSTQTEEPSSSTTSHTWGGYRPVLPLLPAGRLSPLPVSTSPSVTHRSIRWTFTSSEELNDEPLPVLDYINPRRDNRIWLGSDRRQEVPPPRTSFTLRHSHLSPGQQEEPEVRGPTSTSTSSTGDTFAIFGLMAPFDIRTEVAELQMSSAQVVESQSAPTSNSERLRKIKESLLAESSDEEEGDICRICHSGAVCPTNPLLSPCQCSGSLQYIHHVCLKTWIQAKIHSGTTLPAVKTCELCKGNLSVDQSDCDMEELYDIHHQTQVGQASQELSMLQLQMFFEMLQVVSSNTNIVSQVWRLPFLLRTEPQSQRRVPESQSNTRDT
ncbi:hypothetical protein UPYG_G00132890 [Umbra pygmaea]|uniref:RING-type E3 ubiquitin transferase n=1 Tax=Umbra pygmaea TaxID=75934 RepID=A0ABD0WY38_UMBPY